MTIKRLILSVLTVLAILLAGASLLESWKQPQIQSRLELYQTNLLLHAAEWQPEASEGGNFTSARNTLIGEKPFEAATEQYEEVRKLAQTNLEKAKDQLEKLRSQPVTTPTTPKPQSDIAPVTDTSRLRQQQLLQQSLNKLQQLVAELDLRRGLLQAQQGQIDKAIKTWTELQQRSPKESSLVETSAVLTGLWSNPPRLLPNAQQLIQDNLDGWFRYRALSQLYQLQQRPEALATLQAGEQEAAQQALGKLAFIGSIPAVAGLLGAGLLISLVSQRFLKAKESLLAQNGDVIWSTP